MSGDANSSNIPPAICAALPSDLAAVNITETSADLEWTMNGVSSDVEWGIAGFELGLDRKLCSWCYKSSSNSWFDWWYFL